MYGEGRINLEILIFLPSVLAISPYTNMGALDFYSNGGFIQPSAQPTIEKKSLQLLV
jgi:hypothetical protein